MQASSDCQRRMTFAVDRKGSAAAQPVPARSELAERLGLYEGATHAFLWTVLVKEDLGCSAGALDHRPPSQARRG